MTHFTLAELCHSNTAGRLGMDNHPSPRAAQALLTLTEQVLDPLREWYGRPIYVNSGYRSPDLNRLVGGAERSYHLRGMAADIDARHREENRRLFHYIRSHLPFTELIWERGGQWIHVAYDPECLEREVLADC